MAQMAITSTLATFTVCGNGTAQGNLTWPLGASSVHGSNCTYTIEPTKQSSTVEFCNRPMDDFNQYYLIFLIVVFFVSLSGNLIVVVGVLTSRILRSSVTNYFIVSLAISDIGVTVFLLPIKIDLSLQNEAFCGSLELCIFWNLADIFFNIASVTNLLLITIDRFLAVTSPFSYPMRMTRKRALGLITILWLYAALWSVSSLVKWERNAEFSVMIINTPNPMCLNRNPVFFTTVYSAVFVLPLIIMGVLYFVILKAAIRQARAITALEIGNERSKNRKLTRYRREIKATKTIAIVYGAFFICWMPVCIITMSSHWCGDCYLKLKLQHPDIHKFIYITFVVVLPPLNSALNPFIYVIFGKQFRAGVQLLVYRLLGKARGEASFLDATTVFTRDRFNTLEKNGLSLRPAKQPSVSDSP